MFSIGNITIPDKVVLAPMAGITSLPYRKLNRRFGATCTFAEMVDARSLCYIHRRTKRMIEVDSEDRPLGIQLVGKDAHYIGKAIEILSSYTFDILDFNAACPQKKIAHNGKGAGLLKTPAVLSHLLESIVKQSTWPVTVKMRLGWDSAKHAVDLARRIQDTGVSAITVHGRTKEQGYSGIVDHESIRQIKKSVKIPVIASGDIFDAPAVQAMLDKTGCDAVAVARGALGNPWIFRDIKALFEGKPIPPPPSAEEVGSVMLEHCDASIAFYGDRIGVIDFRKFFGWYTKGFHQTRKLRKKLSAMKKREDVYALVEEFKQLARHGD